MAGVRSAPEALILRGRRDECAVLDVLLDGARHGQSGVLVLRGEPGVGIGAWTAWGTIAGALGPLVAGVILNIASWRWIFVINLPLVVACLWLILRAVPPTSPTTSRRRVDVVGALLCVWALAVPCSP